MKATFISVWDSGHHVIRTTCDYDAETGIVSNIEIADVDDMDLNILERQYVLLPGGDELEVRQVNRPFYIRD